MSILNKLKIIPDPKYRNFLVAQFINLLMKSGKKLLAQRIVYSVLKNIKSKFDINPVFILTKALNNMRPKFEIKNKRVVGATYQIPIEIPYKRQTALAFRWLIAAAKKQKNFNIINNLTLEIIDGYNNLGLVIKKKDEVTRVANANKAFLTLKY